MKNFKSILKAAILSQVIFSFAFGQTPESNYLIKPMSEYKLSANTEGSKINYNHCEKIYSVDRSLNTVWDFYTTLNTKDAWNSVNSKYIMSYDGHKGSYNTIISESFDTLKQDKVFLLELTFLKVVKIPVIFQITKIDPVNKIIQFTYMKENKSNGFQTLEFTEKNGTTYIKHSSYYASGNKLRDHYIYPTFHEVATDDFHAHVFQLLKNKVETKIETETGSDQNDLADANIQSDELIILNKAAQE